MTDFPQQAHLISTEDGSFSLFCEEIGECYHSRFGAKSEAMGLYIRASQIAERWRNASPLYVLDVGLGLGYNALCTLESWLADPQAAAPLCLTSFEKNQALFNSLRIVQGPWQVNWPESWRSWIQALAPISALHSTTSGEVWKAHIPHPTRPIACEWTCVTGDIRETLFAHAPSSGWERIWYDPFSAKKAPELWAAPWLTQLRTCVAPSVTLVTYSVARSVREAFAQAGWSWEKVPTDTGKRSWLRVRRNDFPSA